MRNLFGSLCLICIVVATAFGGVNISSPANGANIGSPAHVVASASSNSPIVAMQVYVDNALLYTAQSASIDTYVPVAAGNHTVVVQSWDAAGAIAKTAANVSVGGGSASTAAPSVAGATTITHIERMAGWDSCTECAGAHAAGPRAQYGMAQNVGTPSLDGAAAQFSLGGPTPYSDALWWKQLGANSNASHFVYDLSFYMAEPWKAQALEFDVNQSVGGFKYIMGVQCNIRDGGQWDVWDGQNAGWAPTGIPCPMPAGNVWHHLTEEFSRGNNGEVNFIAITLDGQKFPVNRTFQSLPNPNVNEINVAFQMDGDYAQHPYQAWLERVSLTYW